MSNCGFCPKACGNDWCSDKKKVPREASKAELSTMLSQIDNEKSIAIFNAQKACYVYIDSTKVTEYIKTYLNDQLEQTK